MKRKIFVTTGTRAEYGLLYPILKQILKSKKLELILIVTGSHLSKKHGYTINEIKKDKIPIHAKIPMIPKDDTNYSMAITLGEGIIRLSKIFKKFNPDINLILGDRDEMLASALVASHLNIPNAHIHGGDISGGIDEYNRHAITKISNIHFAATKKSKERIIKMGENKKFVFFTGSPSIDEIFRHQITSKTNLQKKYKLQFSGEEILLLFHPVTTEYEKTNSQITKILNAIIMTKRNTIAIFPNSDPGHKSIFLKLKKYSSKFPFIKLYPNLPRTDYLGMLNSCGVLLGNSSSGMIEASYFPISVINLGIRQNEREHGKNVINVKNIDTDLIFRAIRDTFKQNHIKKIENENLYGNGTAARKITQILEKIPLNKQLIQKKISY